MFPRPTLCKTHAPCFCCMGFDTGGLRLLDRPWRTLVSPLDLLVDRKVQSPLPALRKVRDRIRQSRFRLYSKEVAPTIEWLDQKGDRTGWVFNRFLSKLPALPLRHSISTRLLPTLLLSCRNCVAYLAQHFLFFSQLERSTTQHVRDVEQPRKPWQEN